MQSLLGNQSAVNQLLELMVQHPPAGQPGAPPPPPVSPAPQPHQNILGSIHDFIQNKMAGGVPAEYRATGLLSPEEMQSAKPGIMQMLSHGGAYRQNLDRMMEMKGVAEKMGEARRISGVRKTMETMFEPKPDETPGDTMGRLQKMMAFSMQHGDLETADKLKGIVAEMAVPKSTSSNMKEVPGVGLVDVTDPAHPKMVMTAPGAPRNIDPLSPAGIAAQLKLKSAAADLKGGSPLAAPMAAKVGQAGEMIKKLADLMPQMDALDVSLSNSAAEDVAEKGVGVFGMHIPGTKGIGSKLVNRSPEYSKYEASLSPFVLAAAHALSGARINMDQVEQIRRSVKYEPGDGPKVKAQKRKNLIDLVNSISGSLPADAIASQEDQMDPAQLGLLKGYGYRGAARKEAGAPRKKTAAEILAAHNIK